MICMGFLVLIVLWQVMSRYVMRSSNGWTEELAEFSLIWISILGTSFLFYEKSHLGVEFIVSRFKQIIQKKIEWSVHLIVLFFVGYVMIQGSAVLFQQSLASGQVTPVLGINMAYVYSVFLFSSVNIFIFTLGHLMRLSWVFLDKRVVK